MRKGFGTFSGIEWQFVFPSIVTRMFQTLSIIPSNVVVMQHLNLSCKPHLPPNQAAPWNAGSCSS